jgi:hypothetical protein
MRLWGKRLLLLVVAFVVSVPFTWIAAMALTPLLWKLEPILHMELAGHSGPSDWVFYVIHAFVTVGVFALLLRILDRSSGAAGAA